MKKLLIPAMIMLAGLCSAEIAVRDVTFAASEIPATNPRVERVGTTVTHIEVFGVFVAQPDGSVNTRVSETAIDMDVVAAQLWVNEAKKAVGLSVPKVYSKLKIKMAIANLGYLPALESWLASAEVAPGYSALAAWNDANVISDDFPGFETYYAAALAKFGITREQGDAILSQCIAD